MPRPPEDEIEYVPADEAALAGGFKAGYSLDTGHLVVQFCDPDHQFGQMLLLPPRLARDLATAIMGLMSEAGSTLQ